MTRIGRAGMMRLWVHVGIRTITGLTLFGGSLVGVGCAPTFNWREVRLEGSGGLVALFPCKPDVASQVTRMQDLRKLTVRLWTCRAGDHIWSVAMADVGDVRQIASVLGDWSTGIATRPGFQVQAIDGIQVRGAPPQQPAAQAWKSVSGVRAGQGGLNGLEGWTWHFSHGLQVYQISVWRPAGSELPTNSEDVVSTFKNGFYFQK